MIVSSIGRRRRIPEMDNSRLQIEVRTLTRDELALIGPLWIVAGLSARPLGRDSLDQLIAQWKANVTGFIGAFDDVMLIGSVLATDDGRRGWINRLAVHPSYRHAGLGRRLITAAEDVLKGRGLQITAALIDDHNSASQSLFKSCGYELLPEILYYSKRESPDV